MDKGGYREGGSKRGMMAGERDEAIKESKGNKEVYSVLIPLHGERQNC